MEGLDEGTYLGIGVNGHKRGCVMVVGVGGGPLELKEFKKFLWNPITF